MSHPIPGREYGEHPDEPQHKEWLKTQGLRNGHVKSKVTFLGKTGIPTHKLRKGLPQAYADLEHGVKKMLSITPNSGIGAKGLALKGRAGQMHKRAVDPSKHQKRLDNLYDKAHGN